MCPVPKNSSCWGQSLLLNQIDSTNSIIERPKLIRHFFPGALFSKNELFRAKPIGSWNLIAASFFSFSRSHRRSFKNFVQILPKTFFISAAAKVRGKKNLADFFPFSWIFNEIPLFKKTWIKIFKEAANCWAIMGNLFDGAWTQQWPFLWTPELKSREKVGSKV